MTRRARGGVLCAVVVDVVVAAAVGVATVVEGAVVAIVVVPLVELSVVGAAVLVVDAVESPVAA